MDIKQSDPEAKFAKTYGSPGARPRVAGLARAACPLLMVLVAGGYLLGMAFPAGSFSHTAVGFVFLALAVVLAASVNASSKRVAAFMKGAQGEEAVARALSFLPSSYDVFHGVALPGRGHLSAADCDHVVVGKGGLFVIETKNWSGRITVREGKVLYNGTEPTRPPLEQVRQAAGALQKELVAACGDVTVQPLVCFASDPEAFTSTGASGVMLCHVSALATTIFNASDQPLREDLRERILEHLHLMLSRSS